MADRLDILVGGDLILEEKAAEAIAPVHKAKLLLYLRLSNRRLGLLLNFNVVYLREDTARVVNKLYGPTPRIFASFAHVALVSWASAPV